jgi:hypothetical protein
VLNALPGVESSACVSVPPSSAAAIVYGLEPLSAREGRPVGTLFGLLLLGFVLFLVGSFIYGLTPAGQESVEKAAAEKAERQAAYDAARTLTGPGWKLVVAGDGVILQNRTIATTGATITNLGSAAAKFAVEAVIRDSDNVRLGTILAMSSHLPPGDSEMLVLRGVVTPLTTKALGRHSFEVKRY